MKNILKNNFYYVTKHVISVYLVLFGIMMF
jgi:hypothetical protein